jgi:Flp pilus assembly protein TadG
VTRARTSETGALAVELVIVIPALLLLVALVFAYGRVAQVNGTLEAGVRDAARSASQARDPVSAQDVAERVIREALGPGATECQSTLEVVPIPVFVPGEPVTVSASCRYPMGDLGLPGVPGSVTTRSTFSSPLDPNRGIR